MNPFKRLKLKSQLRNCDYVLAGTVIKQQYYDSAKSTVINGLIDDFMANPNFDNALKLIEYNEMLTFYFTESCAGGLYVRKSSQDAPDTGDATADPYHDLAAADSYGDEEAGFAASGRTDGGTDDWADSWIGSAREASTEEDADAAADAASEEAWEAQAEQTELPALSEDGDEHGPLQEHAGDTSGDGTSPTDEDLKRKFRQERQQQILRESEALMEQLLSLDMRRRKSASQEEPEPAAEEWPVTGLTAEEEAGEADMATRTYNIGELGQEEAAPAAEFAAHEDPEEMDTAAYADGFGITEADADGSFAAATSPGSADTESRTAEAESFAETREQHDGDPARAEPEAPVHRLPRRSYANVIATLKIDIHTMATQLEDYRRQLSYNPPNEQQLIVWINALEDAIEEFSQVVDHLEEQH